MERNPKKGGFLMKILKKGPGAFVMFPNDPEFYPSAPGTAAHKSAPLPRASDGYLR